MPDPFELLTQDHRTVERLLTEIEQAEGEARTPLLEQLATELDLHMSIEERHVYPTVREAIDEETVDEAETEHELTRRGLQELQALAPDAPGFGAALSMLRAGIQHHVEEEEGEVFPQLRRELDDDAIDTLADEVVKAKEEGDAAGADLEGKSKAELLEQARKAGLPGRSSMTKDELRDALAEAGD